METMEERFPFLFNTKADYNTNSQSYYDGLAKYNKLLQILAKMIEEYDVKLDNSLANINTVLTNYTDMLDGKLAGFDQSVMVLLAQWIDDGTFAEIINTDIFNGKLETTIFEGYKALTDAKLIANEQDIALKANQSDLLIEKARIDTFTSLPVGSTSGDADLMDGRIRADGIVSPNIGTAIRSQFNDLTSELLSVYSLVTDSDLWEMGGLSAGGGLITSTTMARTLNYLPTDATRVSVPVDYQVSLCAWDSANAFIGRLTESGWGASGWYTTISIGKIRNIYPTYKYKLLFRKVDNTAFELPIALNAKVYTVKYATPDDLNNGISIIENSLMENVIAKQADFTATVIGNTDGVLTPSTIRISTPAYLDDRISEITTINTAQIRVIAYDQNDVYKGMLNNTKTAFTNTSAWHTSVDVSGLKVSYPGYNFRVTVGDVGEIEISTAYASNVQIRKVRYTNESDLDVLNGKIETLQETVTNVSNGLIQMPDEVFAGLGDSIMAGSVAIIGGSFIQYIAGVYGADYVNYSVGGARMVMRSEVTTTDIPSQVSRLIASNDNPTKIILNGGINDVYIPAFDPAEPDKDLTPQSPIGTMSVGFDPVTFDTTTFAGSFEKVLYELKTNFPDAQILYLTTHNASSRDYTLQQTYRSMALAICEKWGVRVADIYKYSGMNTNLTSDRINFTRETTSGAGADGTHPNNKGYTKRYFPVIRQQIEYM